MGGRVQTMKCRRNWLDAYLTRRHVSKAINIPDSDFHDFDTEETESSFGDDQF